MRILLCFLALLTLAGCGNDLSSRIDNHEERIDELENLVRGNRSGTPDPSTSHEARIKALEEKLNAEQ